MFNGITEVKKKKWGFENMSALDYFHQNSKW